MLCGGARSILAASPTNFSPFQSQPTTPLFIEPVSRLTASQRRLCFASLEPIRLQSRHEVLCQIPSCNNALRCPHHKQLQSRLSIYRNQTVNFEERKLLFERAIEATAKRMRDFEKACKEHKEVVEKSDRRQANGSGVNDD